METKSDLITYCLTYKDVYEDYPFRDHEWTVIRHRGNKRVFAWIYRREGQVCINLKCAAASLRPAGCAPHQTGLFRCAARVSFE